MPKSLQSPNIVNIWDLRDPRAAACPMPPSTIWTAPPMTS